MVLDGLCFHSALDFLIFLTLTCFDATESIAEGLNLGSDSLTGVAIYQNETCSQSLHLQEIHCEMESALATPFCQTCTPEPTLFSGSPSHPPLDFLTFPLSLFLPFFRTPQTCHT